MRKAIIIVLAVAILGILGAQVLRSDDPAPSSTYSQSSQKSTSYKDGTFPGSSAETPYGPVQVAARISGGRITDIIYQQMPSSDERSQEITSFSEPAMEKSALAKQSAAIDFVTGATSTVYGFQESLQAALNKAAG